MVTLDDLESDFAAGIAALAKQVAEQIDAETAGMTDGQLRLWRAHRAADHLARLHACDAPDFMIRDAYKRHRRALNAIRIGVRSSRQA